MRDLLQQLLGPGSGFAPSAGELPMARPPLSVGSMDMRRHDSLVNMRRLSSEAARTH